MEEVGGFICNFCHKMRHDEELHRKYKDDRLECDKCYERKQDTLQELAAESRAMYE